MRDLKIEIIDYLKKIKPKLNKDGIINLGLFGSFAKDRYNSKSDIDIVYETTDDFIKKYKGWSAFLYLDSNLRDKISKKFNIKVDLFDLNSSSGLKNKIKKESLYV